MSSIDILSMCLRNLIKRKLRTSLTILGVVIGTASIVVMVSLGLAINEKFAQQLDSMGDVTLINVYDYSRYYRGDDQQSNAPKLNDQAIEMFENIPGVVVATPILQTELYFKSGKYYMYGWYVQGLKPEAMSLLGYEVEQGRLLQEGDKYEVVFGALAEKNFQNSSSNRWDDRMWRADMGEETDTYVDVFKDKITMSYDSRYIWNSQDAEQEYDFEDENAPKPIKPIDIKVVGQMSKVENNWQANAGIFMDINVLKQLKTAAEKQNQTNNQEGGYFSAIKGGGDEGYEQAYVKCTDLDMTKEVYEKITEMGYEGNYPAQWLDNLQGIMQSLQILLAAIGAVSLFVAAIGIANTMIMAIYERTREIGVMKVIGASIQDIRRLFLLESVVIGFFGGAFGVLLSLLASYLLNTIDIPFFAQMDYIGDTENNMISLITPWLCGVAIAFASLVGLLSGYFPARRAMRLSALSAIRTE